MARRPEVRTLRDEPEVRLPSAADDRPAWGKVAVLAVVGFAVGIAWPHLAGVRLGPSAPADLTAAAAAASASGGNGDPNAAPAASGAAGANAPAAVMAAAAPSGSAAAVPPVQGVGSGSPIVTVGRGQVLSCHDASGGLKKGASACGDLSALDAILAPRVKRLSQCAAADAQVGKLAVLFAIDFDANKANVSFGHSSSLQNLDSLGVCMRMNLDQASFAAVSHQEPRYTVLYNATFATRDASAGKETPVATTGNGDEPSALVVWDVAIVRDTPRNGTVVARLQRGTKLHVSSGQDGWYRVRYGNGFSNEGWVYRGAIGK